MSRGVNKVLLIGNLGKDPELGTLPSGSAVAKASIATSESWIDKKTGEKAEKTEWHNLVFFGRVAEILCEYCKKGSKIYVEGKLRTRKWQDKESGQDRYMTEINVHELQLLDGKPGADREPVKPANTGNATSADAAMLDDDIPF